MRIKYQYEIHEVKDVELYSAIPAKIVVGKRQVFSTGSDTDNILKELFEKGKVDLSKYKREYV